VSSLPADLQTLVTRQIVADVAERFTRDAVAKTDIGSLLADRLNHTLTGVRQVRQNDKVQKIMAENASYRDGDHLVKRRMNIDERDGDLEPE
jgi:alkyl hydroperoxide reductase subunit AhpF